MTRVWSRSRARGVMVVGLAVLGLAGLIGAAEKAGAVEAAVRKLEAQRVEAALKGDVGALDRILSADLTYMHSSGVLDTKASFLSSLSSGKLKYKGFDESDLKVRVYGDAAVLTGKAAVRAQRGDEVVDLSLALTAVYAKGADGAWRLVAWQTTRLAS